MTDLPRSSFMVFLLPDFLIVLSNTKCLSCCVCVQVNCDRSKKLTEGSFFNILHQTSVSLAGLSNVMHAFDAYAEKAVFLKSKRKTGLARISPARFIFVNLEIIYSTMLI
jgi:hypothetical protein